MSGDQNGTAPALAHGPDCSCTRCRGFEPGNEAGVATRFGGANAAGQRHGFFASPRMRREDAEEVSEIAEAVVAMMPAVAESDALAVELLAVRIWRWRRALADVSVNGEIRGDREAPILRHLEAVERAIDRSCAALGLSPTSREALGLTKIRATLVAEAALDDLRLRGRQIVEAREQELERG